jgi:plasmid stabilization system protein ParE
MSYPFELSPKAEKELYKAWNWYEDEQPGLGERFEKEIFRKIDLIIINPLHYAVKKGLHEARTDSFPYLIIYKISPKRNIIIIVSIFHMSRHPKKKR